MARFAQLTLEALTTREGEGESFDEKDVLQALEFSRGGVFLSR